MSYLWRYIFQTRSGKREWQTEVERGGQDEKQIQKNSCLRSDSSNAVAAVWCDHAGRGRTDTGRDTCAGDTGSTDVDIGTGDTGTADRDIGTGDTGTAGGDIGTGDTGSTDRDTVRDVQRDRDGEGYGQRDGEEKRQGD